MMPPDFIEYFRALVESNPTAESWVAWWKAHKAQVAMLVPPGVYLRLTYTPHVELYAILEAAGFHYPRPRHYRHSKFHHPHSVPAAWLKNRIDLLELEKSLSPELLENDLTAIREGFQPGDEIWTFCSPQRAWETRMGRSGFAFVRDGVSYDCIVTLMN